MSSTKTSIVNIITYVCFAVIFILIGQLVYGMGMALEVISRP